MENLIYPGIGLALVGYGIFCIKMSKDLSEFKPDAKKAFKKYFSLVLIITVATFCLINIFFVKNDNFYVPFIVFALSFCASARGVMKAMFPDSSEL